MKFFGNDLYFVRRDAVSNIHSAVRDPRTGLWITGCDQNFDPEKIGRNMAQRRPTQLPGKQVFCKRCGQRYEKLAAVHAGKPTKDV